MGGPAAENRHTTVVVGVVVVTDLKLAGHNGGGQISGLVCIILLQLPTDHCYWNLLRT
jgi:hypothetical protein